MKQKKRAVKGQAAMEFLMTYGWAIGVVIAVLGILTYYGMLDPEEFLPEKCQMYSTIACEDIKFLSTGGGIIRVHNGHENDINITNVTFQGEIQSMHCSNATTYTLGVGESVNIDFSPIEQCSIDIFQNFVGEKIRGTLEIHYLDLQTMFHHSAYGTLLKQVE